MLHLGDITKISGYTAPIVDVVVGGSPCQDLSVAGKRAGLDGERSGLFMEQIRIIKEMRERDEHNGRSGVDIRPRYMVWENVPGAFSSNKAEDFRIVLEETAKVADKDAVIPMPPNNKWTISGCIVGNGWSIAWRVLDAQFWGVPQRRRRIALVADFGGQSAPEILFVRKGVSRDSQPSQPQREATPTDASRSLGADDSKPSIAYTLQDREGKAGGGKGALIAEELSATLRAGFAQALFQPIQCIDQGGGKSACNIQEGQAPTLTCTHGGEPAVCYSLDRASFNQGQNAKYDFDINDSGICSTIVAKGPGAVAYGFDQGATRDVYSTSHGGFLVNASKNIANPLTATDYADPSIVAYLKATKYIVRRLTPLECERLQGYPDGWTDIGEWTDSKGKVHKTSDAARYKALGNSIALPPWKWVLKRLCACYERDVTLASLFDGLGGFPLIWEQLNGKGSCLWASEIEEFPIAVTKVRIGE